MGKRSGVTKSGRVMNPADRERKQQRLKELKRNKKERVKIRQAIVKSRDPQELIEHLEKLDDQEFNPENELAGNVIADKRGKYRGAFIQMIALYRTEKNDKEVKSLEGMLHDYELERFQKEQHFKALMFSKSADPDEIPLPIGSMDPDAALTPFAPPPVAPQFHPTMKAGILKKPVVQNATAVAPKKHKYPPGPPCGLPPSLSDEDEEDFNDPIDAPDEEFDFGPVDIPESMLAPEQPVYSRVPPPRNMFGGLPIPPGMAPPPPRMYQQPQPNYLNMPQDVHSQQQQQRRGGPGSSGVPSQATGSNRTQASSDEPNSAAVISAGPQVVIPTVNVTSDPIISAAPQMRNLKRETTRFVPTALRVSRPAPPVVKAMSGGTIIPNKKNNSGQAKQNPAAAKSTDQAYDEFLKE
uniref:WW domain-binding protein 11 n=1 Tax=Ditylenchus dipsaci TaxID=166011 RepID=A0A915E1I1_9BILA